MLVKEKWLLTLKTVKMAMVDIEHVLHSASVIFGIKL